MTSTTSTIPSSNASFGDFPMRILALLPEQTAATFSQALTMTGLNCHLLVCPDAASLVNAFEMDGADLLVVDWMFGSSDRLPEFRGIRSSTTGTPIIALLGGDHDQFETTAISSGVQETLSASRLTSVDVLKVVTRAIHRGAHAKKLGAEITLLKAYNKTLERLAQIDPLTGLSNRKRFSALSDEALARAIRSGASVALLYFDIDRFKLINNAYGHEVGDEALCWFAHHIREQLRTNDNLARVGGDEFVLLVENVDDPQQAHVVAQRVHHLLSVPAELSGHQVALSTSIGIATSESSHTTEELIRHADIAMYHAKQSREEPRICVFDNALENRMRADDRIQEALAQSLSLGEPTVAYQPIFNYAENRVTSAEALFRWPQQSEYDVSRVIALAEANSMIREIDRYAVGTVLDELTRSPIASLHQVSVNSSVLSLDQAYLKELVSLVASLGPLPFKLCLELTETAVSGHFGNMKKLVAELRGRNFAVALDDFGTGYASLKYVRELDLDYLKLDMELVRDVERDVSARAICEAAIDMAHTLNVLVVAEGVSSEDQFETLRDLKCDYAQGFYIARPESLSELAELCAA